MKINIAIETKDRRLTSGQNYLGQTLANLERAGVFDSEHLNSFIVVSGGELPDYYDTELLPIIKRYDHEFIPCPVDGCTRQQNAARAIRYGAMNEAGEWVLKLEDDLDFLDDFLGNVARWLGDYGHAAVPMFCLGATFQQVGQSRFQPGETFLGPGASFPRVREAYRQGKRIVLHPTPGWYAAQALVWRRPAARHLANWLGDDPYLWDGREKHRNRGHDLLLQVWANDIKAPHFASAIPSFVQHIGRRSNLDQPEINHVQPFFEFPFPGREWRYESKEQR